MIANVVTLKTLCVLTKQYTAKTYSSLMIDTTIAFDARVVSVTKKGCFKEILYVSETISQKEHKRQSWQLKIRLDLEN